MPGGGTIPGGRRTAPAAALPALAVLVVLAVLAAVVALPLLRLALVLWQESGGDPFGVLGAADLVRPVVDTVVLAGAVTVTAVPVGVALALVLRRPDLPGRRSWQAAVLLPVLVPDFVLGYSWTQAYARGGFSDSVLGLHWGGLLGPAGVWLVLVVNAAPVVFLVVAAGLAARAEPDLERAARISGAGGGTALRTITLRLLAPAIAAAAALVLVLTLGTFAIPQVLGAPAGFDTVTTRIYADLSIGGDPDAFLEAVALALLLALTAVLFVAPADALLAPRLRTRRPAGTTGTAVTPGSRTVRRALAAVLGGYLLLTTALPLAALVLSSITRAVGVPPTPGNWSADHYGEVLDARTFEALGRSVVLAVVAAGLLVLLGALVAVGERRRSGRAAATLITATLVLPGSALAVALLIAYGRWLSGSLSLILLAYLAKLWAFAHRPIAGALDRLPADELRAARVSGAGAATAVRTVALRPLAPALLGAWLVCFLTALHEVTMSSLLYGPGSETLAVIVLNSQELGRIGPTAALSVLLTVLVAVPALCLWWALGRLRTRAGSPALLPSELPPGPARVG